jgi:alkanesulfonate monooxygenase SsuD/methylene tetrahydromethanopterin reductase-like flavin-dependent oxidoreductase (luciferase family)
MKLGVALPSEAPSGIDGVHWVGSSREAVSLARVAEAAGFDHFWVTERNWMDITGCPSALVLAAALLSATSMISIVAGPVDVMSRPVEEICRDAYHLGFESGGRFELGIAGDWADFSAAWALHRPRPPIWSAAPTLASVRGAGQRGYRVLLPPLTERERRRDLVGIYRESARGVDLMFGEVVDASPSVGVAEIAQALLERDEDGVDHIVIRLPFGAAVGEPFLTVLAGEPEVKKWLCR